MTHDSQQRMLEAFLKSGTTQYNDGNYDAALEQYQKAQRLSIQLQDLRYEAYATNNIGLVYNALGRRPLAQGNYDQALDLLDQLQVSDDLDLRDSRAIVKGNQNVIDGRPSGTTGSGPLPPPPPPKLEPTPTPGVQNDTGFSPIDLHS